MVKTTKNDEKVETPTSKTSYAKVVTGVERSESPHQTSHVSSPVATAGFTLNQSNKEKKREKARQSEEARREESIRADLQAEISKAKAEVQAASDLRAEADRTILEQAAIIKEMHEKMGLEPTLTRTQTHPSTAPAPVRGENSQADAANSQAKDNEEKEEGEMDDPDLKKGADATFKDPGVETGGET